MPILEGRALSIPRRVLYVVIGLLFAVALLSPLIALSISRHDVKAEARARADSVAHEGLIRDYAACLAGNAFRADDLEKWRFILRLSGKPARPGSSADRFTHFIEQADKPRDCGRDPRSTP